VSVFSQSTLSDLYLNHPAFPKLSSIIMLSETDDIALSSQGEGLMGSASQLLPDGASQQPSQQRTLRPQINLLNEAIPRVIDTLAEEARKTFEDFLERYDCVCPYTTVHGSAATSPAYVCV
jgi:hypothetical protein